MKLTFSADLTASTTDRSISGKIVPIGSEVGNTSAGKVVFEQGSIQIPADAKIKLLSQHDMKKPLGIMKSHEITSDAIYASFRVSSSTKGTDALIMAQEGLTSGLSVGVEVISSKPSRDGVIHVTAARLMEVSLVTEPAFKSAQVTDIAAEEAEEKTQTTESEAVVENTTPETVAAPEVEATAVEAARPTVTAKVYATERIKPISSSEYLGATIKAAMGDDEARRTILAADDSTTTNTGLTLPSHLQQFTTTTFSGRPAFEAVTRNSLAGISGMSFTIPKMGTAPTVADADEAATISTTGMTSSYDTVSVNKFAGRNVITWELIDRSSPAFMDLLMSEIRKGYEKATDNALIAAFTASGTAATGVAATAAGLQSFIAVESAAAYKNTGGDYANKLVASTDQWAAINGYVDGAQRPLYAAQGQAVNASGNTVPTSIVGNVLGTSLIVDHNISVSGIVDESAFLIAPNSVQVWESDIANLRVNVLSTGELEIALYGYLAIGVLKGGAGVRRFNLA